MPPVYVIEYEEFNYFLIHIFDVCIFIFEYCIAFNNSVCSFHHSVGFRCAWFSQTVFYIVLFASLSEQRVFFAIFSFFRFDEPIGKLQSVVSKDMRNLEREKLDALVEEILCRLSCFVFVQRAAYW